MPAVARGRDVRGEEQVVEIVICDLQLRFCEEHIQQLFVEMETLRNRLLLELALLAKLPR